MKPDEASIKKARQKIKEIQNPKSKNNSDKDLESESNDDDNL